MTERTKAVNLTEDEIYAVIKLHAMHLSRGDEVDYPVDRINYLNKRLKAFKEPETEIKSEPTAAAGWGTGA